MASSSAPGGRLQGEKMLTDLPPEIHELILSSLSYFPLINLSLTNHTFHNLITKDHIKSALLALERRAVWEGRPLASFRQPLQDGQWTMLSTHLPCYTCLLGLPAQRYFFPSQTTGAYTLGGSAAWKRRCCGCGYNQKATRLTDSQLFFAEGNTWIECVRCKKTKRFVEENWSKLAWMRRRCCFDCYWADCGDKDGEIRLVPFELDGQEKALLEVPIQREELIRMLNFRKMELKRIEVSRTEYRGRQGESETYFQWHCVDRSYHSGDAQAI